MNSSGAAVKKITTYYKLPTTNCIVVHDDLDIPLGKIKVSQDKSAGGHKGVESIIDHLQSQEFTRLRLGINNIKKAGGPSSSLGGRSSQDFVLGKFKPEEKPLVARGIL